MKYLQHEEKDEKKENMRHLHWGCMYIIYVIIFIIIPFLPVVFSFPFAHAVKQQQVQKDSAQLRRAIHTKHNSKIPCPLKHT